MPTFADLLRRLTAAPAPNALMEANALRPNSTPIYPVANTPIPPLAGQPAVPPDTWQHILRGYLNTLSPTAPPVIAPFGPWPNSTPFKSSLPK